MEEERKGGMGEKGGKKSPEAESGDPRPCSSPLCGQITPPGLLHGEGGRSAGGEEGEEGSGGERRALHPHDVLVVERSVCKIDSSLE